MTNQLLFYGQAKPVNATEHKDLYVKTGVDYGFAQQANSVPLTVAEFAPAAAEYAIVFAGTDEAMVPAVILGAQKDQNLYIAEDGSWNARYIPAYVRRYPFVFAQSEDQKTLTLCIDDGYAGVNRDGRGERLFDADGERTAYLEQVVNFQRAYQVQHQRTQAFCRKLVELDLLQPVQATLQPNGGERRVLGGLRVVDRNKLKQLDAATLETLVKNDELEIIYLHLHSLANLRVIGERIPQPAEDTAPAAEAEAETAAPETDAAAEASAEAAPAKGKKAPTKH